MKKLKTIRNSFILFFLAAVIVLTAACGKSSITADDLIGSTEASVTEAHASEATSEAPSQTAARTKESEAESQTAAQAETTSETESSAYSEPDENPQPAPAPETAPETYPETFTVPETIPETIPENVPETIPQTVPETIPETEPEPAPEPESFSVTLTVDAGGSEGVWYADTVTFTGIMTVYDLLMNTGLSIDANGYYVRAIGDLAEKQHGPMSGWLYQVNGVTPMKASNP